MLMPRMFIDISSVVKISIISVQCSGKLWHWIVGWQHWAMACGLLRSAQDILNGSCLGHPAFCGVF